MTDSDSPPEASPTPDGLIAAVDLGSNSFHMVLGRYHQGSLEIVDRYRELVQMAAGLSPTGILDPRTEQRCLRCLSEIGEKLATRQQLRIRAIATQSVRRLADPESFLARASDCLGHPIEVVSGQEEARLVYLGVAASRKMIDQRRLVIDVGGGSTECVLGQVDQIHLSESLPIGCVAITRKFFTQGSITARQWQEASDYCKEKLRPFALAARAQGWGEVLGSSGSFRAVAKTARKNGISEGEITPRVLWWIKQQLVAAGHIHNIRLQGISETRQLTIAGGAVVIDAAMAEFGFKQAQVSKSAMREGILYDIVGVKASTVASLLHSKQGAPPTCGQAPSEPSR